MLSKSKLVAALPIAAFLSLSVPARTEISVPVQPKARGTESNAVVLRLADPKGKPVAGAKVGTYLDFSDVAEDPPVFFLNHYEKRHAVRGYVTSDSNGRAVLPARDLFWRNWPKNRKTPLVVLHESRRLCGLCEVSQGDVGKEVKLTLQPACRVHGRFTASSMRKRGWSPKVLTVYLFWKKHWSSQYTSKQRRFEFLLPPGRYRVMMYSDDPDKAVESRIEIKAGRQELDVCRLLGLRTKR